jgi:hypothetical protein
MIVRLVMSGDRSAHHGRVELFDISLLAAPVSLVLVVVASVWTRSLLPIGLLLVGSLIGALAGRLAWEWFAHPNVGVEFGSEFEGYDWVLGSTSVGALIGALSGAWIARRKRRLR